MYQIKINNIVEKQKEVVIADGEQMIDENGLVIEKEQINENGELILDESGDPIVKPFLNATGKNQTVMVNKTQEEINLEKLALIIAKKNEIKAEVDAYKAAQENQRKHGGPGPVATEEIMKIVNEYNGQFEVVFKEE